MDTELLATNTVIPPQGPPLVVRNRLRDLLSRGVPSVRLTLVTAPAGYGKTTLVAQWARESELPVAWLTATEADNTTEHVLRGLLLAWEAIDPEIRSTSGRNSPRQRGARRGCRAAVDRAGCHCAERVAAVRGR